MQTRDQKRAASAFDRVSRLKPGNAEAKKYGGMAHKLPVLVRTAGLAQALAFVQAKKHTQLLDDLAETVGQASGMALLEASRAAEMAAYVHLTREVLAACLWYKRFAQSVLGVELSDEPADEGRSP